jgi:hypothetical protein
LQVFLAELEDLARPHGEISLAGEAAEIAFNIACLDALDRTSMWTLVSYTASGVVQGADGRISHRETA